MNSPSVIRTLLSARLRWYLTCTGRLMVRNWQWFVLATLLLPPPVLLFVVSYPFFSLFVPDVSITLRMGQLVLLSALVALWVYPQRRQILGKAFEPYFLTLPLIALQVVVVDIAAIFLASSLVLMPALGAMFMSRDLEPVPPLWRTVSLLVVVCIMLLSAYAVLRQRWHLLYVVMGANVLVAIALSVPGSVVGFIAHLLAWLATLVGLMTIGTTQNRSNNNTRMHAVVESFKPLQTSSWIGIALPWKILGEHPMACSLRLVTVCMASVFAIAIQRSFDYDARALIVSISIVAFNTVVLSGLSRHFQQSFSASKSYIAALPLISCASLLSELSCLLVLSAPFTALVTVSLIYTGVMTMFNAIGVATAQLFLLTMLHQVVARSTRHAVVISLLLGIGWTWGVMESI